MRHLILPVLLGLALAACQPAPESQETPVQTVTEDNFVRAETDTYFAGFVKEGAFGKFTHSRELTDIADQPVVRMNRDTLYSRAVFDLDAGPVTVTLPDAKGRFMSLLLVNEDHYNPATFYDPGPHTITRELAGTRYVTLVMRIFVNPGDPEDLPAVHALQDAIKVEQASTGSFVAPAWDTASLAKVRGELAERRTTFDASKAFGTPETVNPADHLIGTAIGWGGNPPADAIYVPGQVAANDGQTVHRLRVKDVPVDGFWSVSVYNKDGFFEPNPQNAYSLNDKTAGVNRDDSTTIQFGGCDDGVRNCLPITPGWNYTVRLYRPRAAILDGSWTFPKAEPVS